MSQEDLEANWSRGGGVPDTVALITVDPDDGAIALIDCVSDGQRISCFPSRAVYPDESPGDAVAALVGRLLGPGHDGKCTLMFVFAFPLSRERHAYYRMEVHRRETKTPMSFTAISSALHRPIRPHVAGEVVLRATVTGDWPAEAVVVEDSWSAPAQRVRAGMIVVSDGRLLVIARHRVDADLTYELPGGGVEATDETPAFAAQRELGEETGLVLEVDRQLARMREAGWWHHYFLPRPPVGSSTINTVLRPEDVALSHGNVGQPIWMSSAELRQIDLWPRRLVWRVAGWMDDGDWPQHVVELTDAVRRGTVCSW